jgi:carbonic anhydrase/acetyltransferase-like protein (isoleucine patch superfamily)
MNIKDNENDGENIQKQILKIHPDSIVSTKANLQGNIVIGTGTIIHPRVFFLFCTMNL